MRPQFDWALNETWSEMRATGVRPLTFVQSFQPELGLFMDRADLDTIVQTKEGFEHVCTNVKRVVESSTIGENLFHFAWLQMSRGLFKAEVMRRLLDLEHEDFEEKALSGFRELMARGFSNLVNAGHSSYKKYKGEIEYLTTNITIEMETCGDEWEMRFHSHVKTLALNSGLLPLLPWESAIFQPGTMRAVRSHSKIPESLLATYKTVRQAVMEILGTGPPTIGDMQHIMATRGKALKHIDRSFECDLVFLHTKVEELLAGKAQELIMGTLPTAETTMTIHSAFTKYHKVCSNSPASPRGPF